ncbi:hypothetical protein BDV23DRAFT_164577 [Aspergillus alliaceus]|uniref:Uncharacterized protein n=1 Tax=Petromyces alliaceus TaxID=209559 RepID=A0A5N7BW18_PETAA|nr:hypothetical protein BDV23DRAFT_164577 [Aspergillus alliaceus]
MMFGVFGWACYFKWMDGWMVEEGEMRNLRDLCAYAWLVCVYICTFGLMIPCREFLTT